MKAIRLSALALGAALALLAAVYLMTVAFAPRSEQVASTPAPAPRSAAERQTEIEKTIAGTPGIAPFFQKLHDTLPAVYDAAIRKAQTVPAGASTDDPDHWLSDAVKLLRQSHGTLAAKAEAGPLGSVFAQQAAVLSALSQSDARLCVDFLYGGASDGFFRFARNNRETVGDLALAGLQAIVDGRDRKIERGAPTDADFTALENALRDKGLDAAEIAALLDGKSPEPPLPDARLCEIGKIYLATLAEMPEDVRLRLYALAVSLMARS